MAHLNTGIFHIKISEFLTLLIKIGVSGNMRLSFQTAAIGQSRQGVTLSAHFPHCDMISGASYAASSLLLCVTCLAAVSV